MLVSLSLPAIKAVDLTSSNLSIVLDNAKECTPEKTHVNWVSVVGTGNEYPILSLIRFSPYMLPAGHERRV